MSDQAIIEKIRDLNRRNPSIEYLRIPDDLYVAKARAWVKEATSFVEANARAFDRMRHDPVYRGVVGSFLESIDALEVAALSVEEDNKFSSRFARGMQELAKGAGRVAGEVAKESWGPLLIVLAIIVLLKFR